MINKRNSSSLGFSLAEILVTVAILGILSTIAVNVSVSEADRAKVNTAQIALAGGGYNLYRDQRSFKNLFKQTRVDSQ
ncbi:prepilin-type N-terminal cleavage/methylation domain-containing protein [Cyanobium sp. WKJ7-Wakatipu]|uniref:type IV pilin protein n=1 Tax=Cyanobium sp. WKJ7-Wakatipu TaxID=2823726 RepID=UPI0020CC03BE|nr:prepilin-type N-terminal cleavage/methylation domain-containing protein [Cyanobium sp. WKJ7-Wakatipu]MCP9783440.1 prepilin-type N-terminal cleavage/methylation domain-containing protein [Cyanobium sp. WKJ7-Wakatipu]